MRLVIKVLRIMSIVMVFFFTFEIKAHAQIGSTGYPIVVPTDRWGDERYITIEHQNDWRLPGEQGLFELDGKVIYLSNNCIPRVRIVDGYYVNQDGEPTPYTEETKPFVDAMLGEMVIQKKAELENLYGIKIVLRKSYNEYLNFRFLYMLEKELADYPDGVMQVISRGSKAYNKKILTITQRYEANEDEDSKSHLVGLYDDRKNEVQTSYGEYAYFYEDITIHELGHSMEGELNRFTKWQLKAIFNTLNNGCAYNQYYYYSGNPSLLNTQPRCFKGDYAATSFEEDFAETFRDAVIYNNEELAVQYSKGYISPEYLQKILYVKNLFNQYAGAELLK